MAVLLSLQGIETLAAFWLVFSGEKATGNLVLTDQIQIGFSSDSLAKFFVFLIALGWLLVSIYATVYMKHEEKENRFFLFMLLSESAMMGAALSSNLVSMYLFYEMITLFSMPLVLHSLSKESVAAAKKYQSKIKICNLSVNKDKLGDAKSMIHLMTMNLVKGSEVSLCAEGEDEQAAVDALIALIESGCGEGI